MMMTTMTIGLIATATEVPSSVMATTMLGKTTASIAITGYLTGRGSDQMNDAIFDSSALVDSSMNQYSL